MNFKNIKRALIGVFAILVFNSAFADGLAKGFVINASSNMSENTLVVLSKITDAKLEIIDSSYTSKTGAFNFEGDAPEESWLYYLTFETANPPGVPVVLETGAKVKLEIDKGAIVTYNVEGGKYNTSMQKLHTVYTSFDRKMMDFNAEVAELDPASVTEELRANTTARYNALIASRSVDIENYIKSEPASPATYFAVKYLFQKPVPKLVMLAESKMVKELPNSSYAKNLTKLVNAFGPTAEGAMAPDIKLLSPQGDSVALSSLRGKVVLIDFWASWCGPCRKENPNVVKLYNRFKDKGFEIYSVSLDSDKKRWEAAIAKDGLNWYHVSDLKGWKSSAGQLYGVHSIPQTFLIDQEGRIIKAGLRSHQLEQVLTQLLQ